LPTSRDLAEVVTASDQSRSVRRLIDRCVIEPRLPEELSDDVVEAISRAMAKADPQAEIIISLGCLNCGKRELLLMSRNFSGTRSQRKRSSVEIDALARLAGAAILACQAMPRHLERCWLHEFPRDWSSGHAALRRASNHSCSAIRSTRRRDRLRGKLRPERGA
jgi:hypothetical protein